MADPEQLRILMEESVKAWNAWRQGAKQTRIDLSKANLFEANIGEANLNWAYLRGAYLAFANLRGANLSRANLSEAHLFKANLGEADLSGANLSEAELSEANLRGAHLSEANLREANLHEANLRGAHLDGAYLGGAHLDGANLTGAVLNGANLMEANLNGAVLNGANLMEANLNGAVLNGANLMEADLSRCRVFGVSAWRLTLNECTKQQDLVITPLGEPEITVDDIEVAQFLYLLIHDEKLRKMIDTFTSKVVLILGRFSRERKAVLDVMREALRKRDFLPVIFDFAVPTSRDVTETIKTIAGLARFVIADITDATEVRSELNFVPDFPSLPVQPILLHGQPEPVGIPHWRKFPWFLPTFEYDTTEHLLANLNDCVVAPAEAKVPKLQTPQP
jgi:uncharacterized protein YjbI with pentapeptide repeats